MKLFRKVWAFYGSLIFTITILVFAPLVVIFKLIGGKTFQWFLGRSYYLIPRILFYPCFIWFKVIGKDKIDPSKQYIIVSNHRTYIDIFANPAASPMHFKYLAKDEIRRVPFVGWVASNFCVFVNRSDKKSRGKVIAQMQEAIKDGDSILIYPEGTRNKTDKPLINFHDGAFRLAIASKTPLAVQTVINSDKLNSPTNMFDLFPGEVTCIWDEPIDTGEMTFDDIPRLKTQVKALMEANLLS